MKAANLQSVPIPPRVGFEATGGQECALWKKLAGGLGGCRATASGTDRGLRAFPRHPRKKQTGSDDDLKAVLDAPS